MNEIHAYEFNVTCNTFHQAHPPFADLARLTNACIIIMVALWNRADHYIFILFLSSFFISSPNLSGRRLDVYHTSTHGVALV